MTDPKGLSRQRFGHFAGRYVNSLSHAKGPDLAILLELACPQADWRMLDVATGGGHTALAFAPFVDSVVASDLTFEMLLAARKHAAGQDAGALFFQAADAENLPFLGGYFDLVTCRIAPHHFPDVGRFVRQVARVLKPGGYFVLQDQALPDDPAAAGFVDDFERLRDPSHYHAYPVAAWRQFLEQAGLRVLTERNYIKRHDFHTWAARQSCSPEVVAKLQSMLADAPAEAREWLLPEDWHRPQASFVNRHWIALAQKPAKG